MTTTTPRPGPWPVCPSCGSTRRRCLRPSGHEAAEWHAERVALWENLDVETKARLERIVERPRVRVQPVPGNAGRYAMWCAHCTDPYANSVKTDVEEAAARHRQLHRTGAVEAIR
jgi:hypothetical protein